MTVFVSYANMCWVCVVEEVEIVVMAMMMVMMMVICFIFSQPKKCCKKTCPPWFFPAIMHRTSTPNLTSFPSPNGSKNVDDRSLEKSNSPPPRTINVLHNFHHFFGDTGKRGILTFVRSAWHLNSMDNPFEHKSIWSS